MGKGKVFGRNCATISCESATLAKHPYNEDCPLRTIDLLDDAIGGEHPALAHLVKPYRF